jgi:hypothetical protein
VNSDPFLPRIARELDFLGWFDSIFFAYNLLLFTVALLIPPLITYVYVRLMKGEKLRRLARDMPGAVWDAHQDEVRLMTNKLFRWRTYLGSMTLLTLVLLLGASVMLFLKPVIGVQGAVPSAGLDYSKGANMLMLGPYAAQVPADYFNRLVISLAAFQYGFLGAYTHHIGQLARSYFTLDLTPHTYVDATVRIATGSLVALVLSFALFDPSLLTKSATEGTVLPLVAFFIGFFPSRGLLAVEKLATAAVKVLPQSQYQAEGLSMLPGMSYAHELRLGREGFDTVENLSHAAAVDLAVRTGFSYGQLEQWKGQSWLCAHLREDYESFIRRTAITSREELRAYRESWKPGASPAEAAAHLANGDKALEIKLEATLILA